MAVKIPSKFSSLEYADEFYKKVLAKLGAPTTPGNMIFMKAWRQFEGGTAIYNPWNTTRKYRNISTKEEYSGMTNYNNNGVKNYATLEDGIDATYKTFLSQPPSTYKQKYPNGLYPNVLAALRRGIKDAQEAYDIAKPLQKQGKDLWVWVKGYGSPDPDLTSYVAEVIKGWKNKDTSKLGKGIPVPLNDNVPVSNSPSNTIIGRVLDEKGQPVAGATVIAEPPKEYPDTPFQNSTESDEFRKWLLEKYPEYKKAPKPYNVDPPPQPNSINTRALKKAWDEKGEEYDSTAADSKFASREYVDGCTKKCDPFIVFSTVPPNIDSFFTFMDFKTKNCAAVCPEQSLEMALKEIGTTVLNTDINLGPVMYTTGNIYEYFSVQAPNIRDYNTKYKKWIKYKENRGDDYNKSIDPYLTFGLDSPEEFLIIANQILEYFKAPWYFDYGPDKPTQIIKRPGAPDISTETVTDQDGNFTLNPETWDSAGTITISKEGYEVKERTNIQQTGEDVNGNPTYDVPRTTTVTTPDVSATANSVINQEILAEEKKILEQASDAYLSAQERLANSTNNKKEELKKTLIPFVISLIIPFGNIAVQAIVSKISLDKISDQISCPSQARLLDLINKRNKLAKQVNNTYKTITVTSKVLLGTSTAISAIQAGIAVIEALPYPATGIPPLGLPPLTSGVIETTGSGKDTLKEALKRAQIVISVSTLALASLGVVLGIILRLLNSLDALIQQCANEQDVPFEEINNELNTFVNGSTGISNSEVIKSTQENATYKEFKLEIKLDTSNSNTYPKRFAQALNKIGIPVLKTESSFASDPQVLLDQLKFIIDSNPQLTAE